MMRLKILSLGVLIAFILSGCFDSPFGYVREGPRGIGRTSAVPGNVDACAFWVDANEPTRSVLIGNDKSKRGRLYVWGLDGKLVSYSEELSYPVGVSVRYDVTLKNGDKIDIVMCGIGSTNQLKAYRIDPKTRQLIDITTPGGIYTHFERNTYGLALYKRKRDGELYVFVSQRAPAPIHQILLEDDGTGHIKGTLIKKFGKQDQKSFVEGMIVDDEYGYLYCSDEKNAILKYCADPLDQHEDPLLFKFAEHDGFFQGREGLALYQKQDGTGYLVGSSHGHSEFKVYSRKGNNRLIKTVSPHGLTDSNDMAITSTPILPKYPKGVIACNNKRGDNFIFFSWEVFLGHLEDHEEGSKQPKD